MAEGSVSLCSSFCHVHLVNAGAMPGASVLCWWIWTLRHSVWIWMDSSQMDLKYRSVWSGVKTCITPRHTLPLSFCQACTSALSNLLNLSYDQSSFLVSSVRSAGLLHFDQSAGLCAGTSCTCFFQLSPPTRVLVRGDPCGNRIEFRQ